MFMNNEERIIGPAKLQRHVCVCPEEKEKQHKKFRLLWLVCSLWGKGRGQEWLQGDATEKYQQLQVLTNYIRAKQLRIHDN